MRTAGRLHRLGRGGAEEHLKPPEADGSLGADSRSRQLLPLAQDARLAPEELRQLLGATEAQDIHRRDAVLLQLVSQSLFHGAPHEKHFNPLPSKGLEMFPQASALILGELEGSAILPSLFGPPSA